LLDDRELLKQGLAARLRGDHEAAIHYFTEAINLKTLSPKDLATVLLSRGISYEKIGQIDTAIADFGAAIEFLPEFWDAYNDRELTWARKGEYDRAVADFTEAAHGARTAYLALNNRGNVFFAARQAPERVRRL
jgi:tetratricopeptide (TPR) repeat protein